MAPNSTFLVAILLTLTSTITNAQTFQDCPASTRNLADAILVCNIQPPFATDASGNPVFTSQQLSCICSDSNINLMHRVDQDCPSPGPGQPTLSSGFEYACNNYLTLVNGGGSGGSGGSGSGTGSGSTLAPPTTTTTADSTGSSSSTTGNGTTGAIGQVSQTCVDDQKNLISFLQTSCKVTSGIPTTGTVGGVQLSTSQLSCICSVDNVAGFTKNSVACIPNGMPAGTPTMYSMLNDQCKSFSATGGGAKSSGEHVGGGGVFGGVFAVMVSFAL
ncbi:UNVERIFIED_CONTAM: hypothetical protein HDU68_011947 [Siphonaria sp. JEL0065]|nr:hypothetical protein HDU68_011947 [Siphonaria sp. JEL0065]